MQHKMIVDAIADESRYETSRCNFCGSLSSKQIFNQGSTAIVRCSDCKLVYANPRLREQFMMAIYSRANYFREQSQVSDDFLEHHETLHDQMLKGILKQIGRVPADGRLLDLGCGVGKFMYHAQKIGWQVDGWEVSEFAAHFAREHLGLNVRMGPMDLEQVPSASYDAVTLIDVLDHVYDPMITLEQVYRILRPGGCLALTMLNFAGLSTFLFRQRNYVLETSEQGPGHVTFFTQATLRNFLNHVGFDQVILWTGEIYLKNFTELLRRYFALRLSSDGLHRKARAALHPAWWTVALYHMANRILAFTRLGDQITALAFKTARPS